MNQRGVRVFATAAIAAMTALVFLPRPSVADEGGVSFWVPGIYGSLAAPPLQPGSSLGTVYYHTSVSASGNVAAAREVTVGRFSPTVNVDLNVKVGADLDLVLINPSYVFATPVLGGQLAVGILAIAGHNRTSLDGTITAGVGPFSTTRTGSFDSTLSATDDLAPQVSLRWNQGVHNFMTYATGDIPVGAYEPRRLANLGIGHGAMMPVPAIPTSTRRPATNSPQSAALPIISRTPIRSTAMVSTSTWMGHFQSICPNSSLSASSVTRTSRSRPTVARCQSWAASNRASPP